MQNSNVPFCCNCKHCTKFYNEPQPGKPDWHADYRFHPDKWKCAVPYVTDIVAGYTKALYCRHMREEGLGRCGPYGFYYEPVKEIPEST